jgi:hypothetical protein
LTAAEKVVELPEILCPRHDYEQDGGQQNENTTSNGTDLRDVVCR